MTNTARKATDTPELRELTDEDIEEWKVFFESFPGTAYRITALEIIAARERQKQRVTELETRVRQLEERCCIDADDIKEHRITRDKVEAWAEEHGQWEQIKRDHRRSVWVRDGKRRIIVTDGPNDLAYNVDEFAIADNRNAWDVLREMAVNEVPGTSN